MSIDSELKVAYRKSGMRDIYEKNKEWIIPALVALGTGGAGAAYGGLAGVGAGALAGGGATAAMVGGGLGLAAGTAGALYGAKQHDAKNDAKKIQALELANKQAASDRVDKDLGLITNDPNSPVTGPVDPNDPVPTDGTGMDLTEEQQDILNQITQDPDMIQEVIGEISGTGGAVNTGGQASVDQQQILNEAELQYALQNERAGTSKADREQMLQEYADLISQQQNRLLDENAPALYEDLNTRGLLRSSELGNAMGRERGKAAQILMEEVGLQGLTDREQYIKAMEGNVDNYLQGRSGAIQRRFSLEDFARQAKVAKDTGIALAPISTGTGSSKAGDAAMTAAGAQVVGAFNGKGK